MILKQRSHIVCDTCNCNYLNSVSLHRSGQKPYLRAYYSNDYLLRLSPLIVGTTSPFLCMRYELVTHEAPFSFLMVHVFGQACHQAVPNISAVLAAHATPRHATPQFRCEFSATNVTHHLQRALDNPGKHKLHELCHSEKTSALQKSWGSLLIASLMTTVADLLGGVYWGKVEFLNWYVK